MWYKLIALLYALLRISSWTKQTVIVALLVQARLICQTPSIIIAQVRVVYLVRTAFQTVPSVRLQLYASNVCRKLWLWLRIALDATNATFTYRTALSVWVLPAVRHVRPITYWHPTLHRVNTVVYQYPIVLLAQTHRFVSLAQPTTIWLQPMRNVWTARASSASALYVSTQAIAVPALPITSWTQPIKYVMSAGPGFQIVLCAQALQFVQLASQTTS